MNGDIILDGKNKKTSWVISEKVRATMSPGDFLTEQMIPNPDQSIINLSVGDPTLNPSLKPSEDIKNAIKDSINSDKFNGYLPSAGAREAREAIADYWQNYFPNDSTQKGIEWQDVIITSGCSQSLDMCMTLLSHKGSNILVPKPCYTIYKTLSAVIGVQIKYYRLLPDMDWEIDLQHLESMIDNKTAAIIYNNPSNPCGSVYSVQHIKDFLDVALKHNLPVIADEVYEDLVFPSYRFYPCGSVDPLVPVLSCSSLSKKFLVPGWRVGWIVIHDKYKRFGDQLHTGLKSLCQRMILPTGSIAQGALYTILHNTPKEYFNTYKNLLHLNAQLAYEGLLNIPGLTPIKPSGAMFIMVGIDLKSYPKFDSDLSFIKILFKEKSVFCYPGTNFVYPGYMRIVLSVPTEALLEALNRIQNFCHKYYIQNN